jgi:RNA polymerase sigma-54 factor
MARLDLSTGLRQAAVQRLALQPRMLQSIEVLQLPSTDLEAYLRDAYEENVALRLEDPPEERASGRPRGTREDSERHDEMLRNQPDREASVAECIEEQLALSDLSEEQLAWVRLLVSCLDERGYLSAPDEVLLEFAIERGLGGGAAALGRAIADLQALEPVGVGARSAVEALMLQLDPLDEDYALLCRLLEEFLEEVAANKVPAVAKALGIDIPRLLELLDSLRELDPRPAAELAAEAAPPIRPEVVVERDGADFSVRVDHSGLPAVSVDEEVQALAREKAVDAATRRYLRERVEHARWIVEAVSQRRATLQRVAAAVFAHQRPFLEHGPGHLRPLRMGEVAERLGVHTSTVSRAVSGVHVDTPFGVQPLRRFFQAEGGGSEDTARDEVREVVREVVEGEDPARPLSDDEIATEAERRGFRLARRTVAKYRNELGIPSSYRRRRYG